MKKTKQHIRTIYCVHALYTPTCTSAVARTMFNARAAGDFGVFLEKPVVGVSPGTTRIIIIRGPRYQVSRSAEYLRQKRSWRIWLANTIASSLRLYIYIHPYAYVYTVAYKYILIYARTYIKNTHLYKVLGYFRVCPTNSTGDRIEET